MKKKIAIVGAGGHGKVVGEIAALNHYEIIDFFDDKIKKNKKFPFRIAGPVDKLKVLKNNYETFFVAIGDNKIRYKIIKWLKKLKVNLATLIHPNSTISQFSTIGVGTCIMANAVVNAGTLVNEGVIVNTSASIDHDCIIEAFSHISPNSSISGNVIIRKFSHIGTGTCIHPGINIGSNVKTAVGSRIFKDIIDNTVYKK